MKCATAQPYSRCLGQQPSSINAGNNQDNTYIFPLEVVMITVGHSSVYMLSWND